MHQCMTTFRDISVLRLPWSPAPSAPWDFRVFPSPGQKTKIEYGKKCERSDSKLASLLQDENLAVSDWSR